MYKKYVYVLFIAFLTVIHAEGKRTRRIRRPNNEDDNTTPQPSVVSYSTFGFNDVGSYDGFVPSSPDYANYLSDNHETTTRLYAPAFPSAVDTTGFNNNFGSQDGSPYGNNDDNEPQSSMLQYPQSSVNFYNTPSFDINNNNNQNKNTYEVYEQPEEESNGPAVYGTKLGSKNKKQPNQINNSEYNVYSSGPLANTNDLASRFVMPGVQSSFDGKPTYGESGIQNQNINSYAPNYPSSDTEEFAKPVTNNPQNSLKFPKVVDFTNVKQYYPTEVDDKYHVATYSSIINHNENVFNKNNEDMNDKFIQPTPTKKENMITSFNTKHHGEEPFENESNKPNSYSVQDYRQNYISSKPIKSNYKGAGYNQDFKDNYKFRHGNGNYSKITINPMKGYEYHTNHSSTSFTYDFDSDQKPFKDNTDELVPASSNIADYTNYNVRDNDYSNFKKLPEVKNPYDDDYDFQSNKDKFKNDELINQFKNLYMTTTTPSSQWGSFFKSNDYSYKHRVKKPTEEISNSDVVHIPKRPFNSFKYNHGKHLENKPSDYSKQRPYKSSKYEKQKDAFNTRFKSEEDLLGLRNHDTSHSSYSPPHRPNNNNHDDEKDYKRLIEKWRQSYLKSKYRDAYRDYESYASEQKPLHVPIPKPYPIEVPQPVIVPVPQPYPVRVPIPKPVAVPIIREITVPVEKPVPYPVIKNVPYPVEKPVPVVVEKEVATPIEKPYPVHIPHVRPVFHHSRPPREEFDSEMYSEEEEVRHRPETSKRIPSYKKKPRITRTRQRRPSRTTYERNSRERRGPQGYRPADRSRRPPSTLRYSQHRYQDYESDQYEEPSDSYYVHCKRTGNC